MHYIFHAATIQLERTGTYSVAKADVADTVGAILDAALALTIGIVWVPLLAAGVASLEPGDSLSGVLEGIDAWNVASFGQRPPAALTIAIVIYEERQLARASAVDAVGRILGGAYTLTQA